MINESKNQIFEVFKNFDKDGSGYVDQQELIEIAKQLNQELSQQEIDKLMNVVDTNKDKKISFEEFWNWWQFGKNGKLEKLVFMKLKMLNLLKHVHSEFTRFGISLEQQYESKFDHHYYCLNYGDTPSHVKIDCQLKIRGGDIKEELQEEKDLQLQYSNGIQIAFVIKALKPEQAQIQLEKILNSTIEKLKEQDIEDEFIQIFLDPQSTKFDFSTTKDSVQIQKQQKLIIKIKVEHPLAQSFIEEQYIPYIQQLGESLQIDIDLGIGIKNGFKKMMKKNQIFIKYLLEGFILELKAKLNSGLAKQVFNVLMLMFQHKLTKNKNFKKEFQQSMTLPMLLKSSKFHLVFKDMDNVEAFLNAMGLEDLAQDQPNARELLQEIIEEYEVDEFKDPEHETHFIYQIYKACCEHLIALGSVHLFMPFAILKINFNLDGLKEVMECIFRDDPESIKEKKEKEEKKSKMQQDKKSKQASKSKKE